MTDTGYPKAFQTRVTVGNDPGLLTVTEAARASVLQRRSGLNQSKWLAALIRAEIKRQADTTG